MFNQLPLAVFLLGTLIFLGGLADYLAKDNGPAARLFHTSLTTRDLAMSEAIQAGRKEYSFTTNFIPGIGDIGNPEAYKKDWEARAKAQLENQPKD